jgi:hypothetical protein
MRTLFLILFVCLSVTAFNQTNNDKLFYCIQVMSTENPELLKPPYFEDTHGEAMVERAMVNGRMYYRILFIFVDLESQEKAFYKWKERYKDSIRVTRKNSQIKEMYPLFSYD